MLIEPLAQIKTADTRLNFSQGALDEVHTQLEGGSQDGHA